MSLRQDGATATVSPGSKTPLPGTSTASAVGTNVPALLMVNTYGRAPVQALASVAVMVMGKLPVWVGVPERTPVDGFSVMPMGSAPVTDQVMVPMPPVRVMVCEYGVPAVPAGSVAGLTVMVWQLMTSV